jgi:hypothetical protein
VLRGTDQVALLVLIQRAWGGLREALARHDRGPEAEEAMADSSERCNTTAIRGVCDAPTTRCADGRGSG